MAEQSKLELIGIAQRQAQINFNNYNNYSTDNNYSTSHTRAKSDDITPVQGKGTGQYMDTRHGGGSYDIYGIASATGSGRLGNVGFNHYNENNGYEKPDTSKNIGQVSF